MRLVEGVDLPQGAEAAFEIVDDRPRGEGLRPIGAYAGPEEDIMVDRGLSISTISEVGLLRSMISKSIVLSNLVSRFTWVFQKWVAR